MDLIQLLVIVIVLGLVYWIVMSLPIPQPFRVVVQVIVALIAIIWLLSLVGFWPSGIRIHR